MNTPWIVAFVTLSGAVLLGLLLVGLLRRVSGVLEQAEAVIRLSAHSLEAGGLPDGSAVPDFIARGPGGEVIGAATLLAEPAIVVFLASDCEPCHRLIADLGSRDSRSLGVELILVVGEGDTSFDIAGLGDLTVVFQREREVALAFNTTATPHAFAVGSDRRVVSSGTPNSFGQLEQLALRLTEGDVHQSTESHIVHA